MIFRFIIAIIVLYLVYKLVKEWKAVKGSSKANVPAPGEDLVEDPVCHTYLPISNARRVCIGGKTHYFCSEKCLDEYCGKKK